MDQYDFIKLFSAMLLETENPYFRKKDLGRFLYEHYDDPEYIEGKNPVGGIDNMEIFNNKLYISVDSGEGLEGGRSNDSTPSLNGWTRVIDKGFGDGLNKNSLAMGVYKDHLYITSIKGLPLILLVPIGAEVSSKE